MLRLVFDCETNNLIPQKVSSIWCLCISDLDSDKEWFFEPKEIDKGLRFLENADQLIGHNILCYDLPVFKYCKNWEPKGIPVDTLVISRLLNPDRTGVYLPDGSYIKAPHSLEAWGARLGRHKVEHEEWGMYSKEMLERCVEDVRINKLLYWRLYNDAKG